MPTLTSRIQTRKRSREESHAMVQTLVAMGLLGVTTLALLAAPVPSGKPGNYPAWWFSRNVIAQKNPTNASPAWPTNYPTSDDYSGINQGQLKNMATAAYNELVAQSPTNVWSTPQGTNLTSMITGWNPTNGDSYAGVNLGQLKTVAKPFYDVLMQIGYTSAYPWTGVGADDYSAANIGQAKYAFSFDVTTAPLAVTGLTATANVNEIDLAWSDPPYNPMANLTVLQSTDGGVTWTTIATLDPGATSFAATNLNPGLSYSYKISSNRNTSGGSAATSATAPAPPLPSPRYALIDLTTNFFPVAMNSNCDMVGGTNLWSQGTNYNLSSGSFTNVVASGIDDSGHMAGSGVVAGTGNPEVIYWARKTSTPSGLGTNVVWPGSGYLFGWNSGSACMGGDGSIIGGVNIDINAAIIATFTPGGSPAWLWSPNPTNSYNYYAWPASKARGHWAGYYPSYGGNSYGAVVDGTQYSGKAVSAVNDSGIAVGQDYGSGNAIIIAGTGSGTTLGTGWAAALNNATVMSGTNVVAQPQIVGYDGSGNLILWDHTNLDGTTSSTYVGKNINKLIPATNGWTVSSVVAINNAGCMAGTANYSGTNSAIPQGPHGILLIPCGVRLLNGSTNSADVDGKFFNGTRPTTISATSPDNSKVTADIGNTPANGGGGNDAIDVLGVDTPFGQGRPDYPAQCYTYSLLVVAKVTPPAANVTYGWGRVYQDRSVTIAKTTTNTWYVTTATNSPTGVPTPEYDTDSGAHQTSVPSTNSILYSYDNPGMLVSLFTNTAPHTNDYAYEKTDFTYSLTNSIGSARAVVTQHVGQILIAKRTGTSGTITNDWTGLTNIMSTTNIPSCATVSTNEIRNIVGGTNVIIFDSSVPSSP